MTTLISPGTNHPSTGLNEQGFKLVEGNITFLKDTGQIAKIIQKKGETKSVKVHCYFNVAKLREEFNYHNNGFQFCALNPKLLKAVQEFNPKCNQSRLSLLSHATRYIYSWGKENGIEGIALPLNLTYRNTDPSVKAVPAFFFAHVDYDEKDLANTLQTNKKNWKSYMETVTGPMTDETYQSLKITAMVNLWMPLNKNPAKNTLALMDISSAENLSEQLRPALTPGKERPITSLGLLPHEKQKWVVQTVMTCGDGVVFNTLKTPHTAADIEDRFQGQPCDPDRQSAEVRWMFVDLELAFAGVVEGV